MSESKIFHKILFAIFNDFCQLYTSRISLFQGLIVFCCDWLKCKALNRI